jgi:hypothetical protein
MFVVAAKNVNLLAVVAKSTLKWFSKRKLRREQIRAEKKARGAIGKIRTYIFRPRRSEERPNYLASTWGRMLNNDRTKDPTDRKGGVLFRRRFRVPYPIFLKIVDMARAMECFAERPDCTGRAAAPLELKVLGVLRVLGRGYCFDGIEELSSISAETNRIFFHKFCSVFSVRHYAEYCYPPTSEADILKTMKVYSKLGFPGAIGSTDCVHIRWERCPVGHRFFHKGKEGYPTLSYEVTCDHTGKIIAVTQGHPGARNDKTIVRFDGFVSSLHEGEIYGDIKYKLSNSNGEEIEEQGLYLIVDGGYHKWRCLQCPIKHPSDSPEGIWSEWLESVRKDVECLFGILKGRFRCLKLPIYYHDKAAIDNMFFTTCIIHNILLSFDGLDVRWEKDINWAGSDGDHADEDMAIFRQHLSRVRNLVPTTDFTLVGCRAVYSRYDITHGDSYEEYETSYTIKHFCWNFSKGKIKWLRTQKK